jgi:hypothetical protein
MFQYKLWAWYYSQLFRKVSAYKGANMLFQSVLEPAINVNLRSLCQYSNFSDVLFTLIDIKYQVLNTHLGTHFVIVIRNTLLL